MKNETTTAVFAADDAQVFWRAARAVAQLAYKTQDRMVLCGLRIRSDGQRIKLTATDSYALGEADIGVAAPEMDVLVHAGWFLKSLPKRQPALSDCYTLTIDKRTVSWSDGVETWTRHAIEGKYPNTDKLFANYRHDEAPDPDEERAFNPKLFTRVLDACSKFSDVHPVRIEAGIDVMKPNRFRVVDPDGTFTAILMPVRTP